MIREAFESAKAELGQPGCREHRESNSLCERASAERTRFLISMPVSIVRTPSALKVNSQFLKRPLFGPTKGLGRRSRYSARSLFQSAVRSARRRDISGEEIAPGLVIVFSDCGTDA